MNNMNKLIKIILEKKIMKLVLFIIDMHKGYYDIFSKEGKESIDNACKYINLAIELFRKNNLPIVWIKDDGKDGIYKDTPGFEIIDKLEQKENEITICKRYRNSFNKTNLINYIIENSIDTIIITGISAARCVLSTYRAAEDYDLKPIILKGSLGEYTAGEIEFVEKISETITIKELETIIEK
jgi:nicotinamidase-related amidase